MTGPGCRRARLGDGRHLVVRPVEPDDVDGLTDLYDHLDEEARYTRFFSPFRPTRAFFERVVSVGDRGGFGLVAVVAQPPRPERLVAEAGYELLPNGNGELAITVARPWRGWLGPFLLDALLEAAAAHGIPNLEADILATNGPMLALARSRGFAQLPREGWSELRVVMGAASRQPTWPPSDDRPRILVEGSSGHALADRHLDDLVVVACPGPGRAGAACPALAGRRCPLAGDADAILIDRAGDEEVQARLSAAHRALHPGVPVCVAPNGDVDTIELVQRLARAHGREAGAQDR